MVSQHSDVSTPPLEVCQLSDQNGVVAAIVVVRHINLTPPGSRPV